MAALKEHTQALREFLTQAHRLFGLDSEEKRGARNPFYIEGPARLSENQLTTGDDVCITNPFIFLTGIQKSTATAYIEQTVGDYPSVTSLVGQYGLGKTELVFQLAKYLRDSEITPLPINLSYCRDELAVLDTPPTAQEFARLLFNPLLSTNQLREETIYTEVMPAVHNGTVFLILDGLDELIANANQHHSFFIGLIRLLMLPMATEWTMPAFRVLITMRLEYLSVMPPEGEIVNTLTSNSGLSLPVYFLQLDYFENSRVAAYFMSRFGTDKGHRLFNHVEQNHRLLDMLRRPLLLRIFCDLIDLEVSQQRGTDSYADVFLDLEYPAELIRQFVERASEAQLRAQEQLTQFTWDLDKLALTSLRLYQRGDSKMRIEDIKSFLRPIQGQATDQQIAALSNEEVLDSIHKCPFLRKDDGAEQAVRFGHRIFFEYFIARGMAEEFQNEDQRDKFIAFDELVLNVDMRKLLKDLVKEHWYPRTGKSYGLDNPEEWRSPDQWNFREFDERRKTLLDAMTRPEDMPPETDETVRWFLEDLPHTFIHPRYLIYNYEAVAIYLWYHRWKPESQRQRNKFSDILHTQLDETLKVLGRDPGQLRSPLELLIERILDIGHRLRYTWAQQYERSRGAEILEAITDHQTRQRVEKIFTYIHNAIF